MYFPTTFPSGSFAGISFVVDGWFVVGSINFAGLFSSIGTSLRPGLKYGLPLCVSPCTPVVTLSNPSGTTAFTIGVYFAVAGVPFVSTRFTVTPLAVPVNCFSGSNVTVPSAATV